MVGSKGPGAAFPSAKETLMTQDSRPKNREVENENLRPGPEGHPPRPATEPAGAKDSTRTDKTRSDPGSGEN